MRYTIRYSRTANHIAGIEARTRTSGQENGGVVGYYAQNACSALTRGNLAQGKSYDTVAEALAFLNASHRKACAKCVAAAEAVLAA